MKCWVGVDPGAKGAIAVVFEDGTAEAYDYPGNPESCWRILKHIQQRHSISGVCVEKQQAMPMQGVVSMFKIGKNFGEWLGIVSTMDVPVELVQPRHWKKIMMLPKGGKKADSIEMATRMWPDVDIGRRDGRAEALLIAEFYRRSLL